MDRLPIDPEIQTHGETQYVSGQAYTLNVYAACPDEGDAAKKGDATKRPLGHVTIRPGLVAPGRGAMKRKVDL